MPVCIQYFFLFQKMEYQCFSIVYIPMKKSVFFQPIRIDKNILEERMNVITP